MRVLTRAFAAFDSTWNYPFAPVSISIKLIPELRALTLFVVTKLPVPLCCLSVILSTWMLYHPSWLCPISVAVSGTPQPSDTILHFRVLLPLSFYEVTCLSLPFLVLFITGGTRINSVVLEFLCPYKEKWNLINGFSLINITILSPYQHDQRLMFRREEVESEADICSNCWDVFKLNSHP